MTKRREPTVIPVDGGRIEMRWFRGRIRLKATADDGDQIKELKMAAAGAELLRYVLAEKGYDMKVRRLMLTDDHVEA